MNRIWRRLGFLVFRRRFERDLEEEMRFHLEMKARENREAGMAPDEALYAARRRLGNMTLFREASREMWAWRLLSEFVQDLCYAARLLRRSPAFTLAAIATLAIGIAANTAIFSFVDAALLKPFDHREPDRLVAILGPGERQMSGSLEDVLFWQRENRAFSGIAAHELFPATLNLTGPSLEYAERVRAGQVTANYFDLLGIAPRLGRTFSPEENRLGKESVAVLSHALWQSRFGSDPQVIGKHIFLDGRRYEIVGVLPPGAFGFRYAYLWVPLPFAPQDMKKDLWLGVTGRLKPGVTLEQARQDMTRLFSSEPPDGQHRKWPAEIKPLRDSIVFRETRTILLLLWGASAFVLLIACTNLASLVLARGLARQHETTIRVSLGAGRCRLVRQFLTESLLLAALGGTLGVFVSAWLTAALKAMQPPYLMPPGTEVSIDYRLLFFGLALSLATGVALGLVPAWRLAAARPMKGISRRRGPGKALLVAEVALAFILVVGAGLMIHSFMRLLALDPGFRAENVLTWQVQLPESRYPGAAEIRTCQDEFLARLRALPVFRAVALSSDVPLGSVSFDAVVTIESNTRGGAMFWMVTPEYYSIMGLRLLRGRWLTIFDSPSAQRVVVVNQIFARKYFGERDPLGRVISSRLLGDEPMTIVGVVAPVKLRGLDGSSWPEIYLPVAQLTPKGMNIFMRRFAFLAQTPADRDAAVPAIRSVAASIDRDLAVFDVQSMEELLADSVRVPRFRTWVFTGFGAIALVLAAIGIYGVISYSVSRRTQEIGVRMALGARVGDVIAMVVREGGRLVLAGIALGLAGSLALTRLLASLLFEVKPRDPLTFAVVAVFLLAVALLACYVPARRAAKVDPVSALRQE